MWLSVLATRRVIDRSYPAKTCPGLQTSHYWFHSCHNLHTGAVPTEMSQIPFLMGISLEHNQLRGAVSLSALIDGSTDVLVS